jgi:hypothetical protein
MELESSEGSDSKECERWNGREPTARKRAGAPYRTDATYRTNSQGVSRACYTAVEHTDEITNFKSQITE